MFWKRGSQGPWGRKHALISSSSSGSVDVGAVFVVDDVAVFVAEVVVAGSPELRVGVVEMAVVTGGVELLE